MSDVRQLPPISNLFQSVFLPPHVSILSALEPPHFVASVTPPLPTLEIEEHMPQFVYRRMQCCPQIIDCTSGACGQTVVFPQSHIVTLYHYKGSWRCRKDGCSKHASFNISGQRRPLFCGRHREPYMVNVRKNIHRRSPECQNPTNNMGNLTNYLLTPPSTSTQT